MPHISPLQSLFLLIITLLNSHFTFTQPVSVSTLPQGNPIALALQKSGYVNNNNRTLLENDGNQDNNIGKTITVMSSSGNNATSTHENNTATTTATGVPLTTTATAVAAGLQADAVNSLSQGGLSAHNIAVALKLAGRWPP